MLMWAYGSNLNHEQMWRRCPRAMPIRKQVVHCAALLFRSEADVTVRKGSVVQGGLWRITRECEEILDRLEGVKHSRRYMKRYFTVTVRGKPEDCMLYVMRAKHGIMPPRQEYLETIRQGYEDFGLDLWRLDAALEEAWGTKKVTEDLWHRHWRRGKPALARA